MEQFKDEILHEAAYVTLINDSVYAIRSHKKHLETLEELHKDRHSLDLVGLTRYDTKNRDEPSYLESVMRTFSS